MEDTSRRRLRRLGEMPHPRVRLRISDCFTQITLEFSVAAEHERRNAQHKIDTLIGALERFRDGLAAEAELAAHRERHLTTHRP